MSKKFLIIGASSGIGHSLAKSLASNGHAVTGTYFKTESFTAINSVEMHKLNVLDESMDLDFLPSELDGLAYCPGSINLKPFKRIAPADFTADFNLQVVGAVKIIQRVLPKLLKSDAASVVLFSTVAVQNGFNFHSQVSTSKGALEGLTRALSAEFAPKIRVNCVAPSLTDTPLAEKLLSTEEKKAAHGERHPLKRVGSANDIASAAQFLLTDQSSWVTGQTLHVDGGMSVIR